MAYANSTFKKEDGIFAIVCLIKAGEIKVDSGQLISIYRQLKFTIKSPKLVCLVSRNVTSDGTGSVSRTHLDFTTLNDPNKLQDIQTKLACASIQLSHTTESLSRVKSLFEYLSIVSR